MSPHLWEEGVLGSRCVPGAARAERGCQGAGPTGWLRCRYKGGFLGLTSPRADMGATGEPSEAPARGGHVRSADHPCPAVGT